MLCPGSFVKRPYRFRPLLLLLILMMSGASSVVMAEVRIAVPIRLSSSTYIVADAQDRFSQAGINVTSSHFILGRDALQAVLDGKADLAIVAETPVIHALLRGDNISVLSGIFRSRRTLAIATRNDRGISKISDLVGKSIAVAKRTNHEYFLEAMLSIHNVQKESVTVTDTRPSEIVGAFKSGTVDAAVTFEPNLMNLQIEMGDSISTFYGEDVYPFIYLLAGNASYVDNHEREVRAFISVMNDANNFIREEPEAARQIIADATETRPEILEKLFDPSDFKLWLDRSLLLIFDDQARWAMDEGLAKRQQLPNFMNAFKHEHLESVLPKAVKLTR